MLFRRGDSFVYAVFTKIKLLLEKLAVRHRSLYNGFWISESRVKVVGFCVTFLKFPYEKIKMIFICNRGSSRLQNPLNELSTFQRDFLGSSVEPV